MDGLKIEPVFEPVAVTLCFTKPKVESTSVFNTMAARLVEVLTTRCLTERQALIGHIKGFAEGDEGSYLRVSASGDGRTTDVEGQIIGVPDTILLTLNIHVFGIFSKRIKALLVESIKEAETGTNLTISIVERS